MTASQALIQYKGRDMSEKLFRADKSFIGSRSERVQSSQAMSSRIETDVIMEAYLKSGKSFNEIMTFLKP